MRKSTRSRRRGAVAAAKSKSRFQEPEAVTLIPTPVSNDKDSNAKPTNQQDEQNAEATPPPKRPNSSPSNRKSSRHQNAAQPHTPWTYHLRTIWLITVNDLKSIVAPETAFGIFTALAPTLTTHPNPTLLTVLSRLPHVILWNWLNVLLFDIANQRLPNSIIEDRVNKPWRPLPTGRLTPTDARRLLLVVIPVVFLATLWLGGMWEAVAMMVLTWMYNDLGAADEVYIVRNVINALGFMCYSSGATDVAAGEYALTPRAYTWIGIVGAIIFSTLSMQDMPDVEGDAVRGRMTSPLVHGDTIARWSIAIPIVFWSFFCPYFWEVGWVGYAVPVAVGGWLAGRILRFRNVAGDKKSWQMWCFWTGVLYALPLFA